MSNDIYAAPEADLETATLDGSNEFYVVSPGKFWVMYLLTFGIYQLYWYYKNWALHCQKHEKQAWPVARAIFAIFFTHSLFGAVNQKLVSAKVDYSWSPNLLATAYVIMLLADRVFDRLIVPSSESAALAIVSLAFLPLIGFVQYRAQLAINMACGDPQGEGNSGFTGLNFLWMLLGLAFWGLALFGMSTYF